jgi:hypothetical protein
MYSVGPTAMTAKIVVSHYPFIIIELSTYILHFAVTYVNIIFNMTNSKVFTIHLESSVSPVT